MKRKHNRKNKTLKKTKSEETSVSDDRSMEPIETTVGGDHHGWNVLIAKLDFRSQYKISQQNKRLAEMVKLNAKYQLQKFRRHIRDNKYM